MVAICRKAISDGAVQSHDTSYSGIRFLDQRGRQGLLWSSIGLAVFTSLLQGLVNTVITIAEDQGMWTFRFRVARYEHLWWITISFLLSSSFALIILSFLSGNDNDSLSVLALSTATAIAVVHYAIPAWRNRVFTQNRWLAWTGCSRTAIKSQFAAHCGDAKHWRKVEQTARIVFTPPSSDDWGWTLRAPNGIAQDPTAILNGLCTSSNSRYSPDWQIGPCVYDDGIHHGHMSLLWGQDEGLRPRVSRAIGSVPEGLLHSRPHTYDGYPGEGLCLGLGILGRTKGLLPQALVFDSDDTLKRMRGIQRATAVGTVTTELENKSTWYPRPKKVMRSYYNRMLLDQFGTLPSAFVSAATELSVLILDVPPKVLTKWLTDRLEQQCMQLNHCLSRPEKKGYAESPRATDAELSALYRAHYVSTILSLNFWHKDEYSGSSRLVRPDLHCFVLLYLAEGAVQASGDRFIAGPGAPEPNWWRQEWVNERLASEMGSLIGDWHASAAWLLGLANWPELDWPHWPVVIYNPEY